MIKYNEPETISIKGKVFRKILNFEQVQQIISNVAEKINQNYLDRNLQILIVLKGAIPFADELLRFLTCDLTFDTVSAQSYGSEMCSCGEVTLNTSNLNISGKDVLVVEDIIETGITLKALTKELRKQNPKSIEIACLCSKSEQRVADIDVKYIGFEAKKEFIVGFGLDYAQQGRQYPAIYQLIES